MRLHEFVLSEERTQNHLLNTRDDFCDSTRPCIGSPEPQHKLVAVDVSLSATLGGHFPNPSTRGTTTKATTQTELFGDSCQAHSMLE